MPPPAIATTPASPNPAAAQPQVRAAKPGSSTSTSSVISRHRERCQQQLPPVKSQRDAPEQPADHPSPRRFHNHRRHSPRRRRLGHQSLAPSPDRSVPWTTTPLSPASRSLTPSPNQAMCSTAPLPHPSPAPVRTARSPPAATASPPASANSSTLRATRSTARPAPSIQ